jgi:hypothetical protein
MRGDGRGGCGVSANDYSCAHHVTWSQNTVNFRDLPPYLTYDLSAHLEHLISTDGAVLIDIIELEAPHDLLLLCSLADDGEELHEVPEGDAARALPVDGAEDQVRVL